VSCCLVLPSRDKAQLARAPPCRHNARHGAELLAVRVRSPNYDICHRCWFAALASGALFGSAVLSAFTAVTAIAQRHLPPPQWGPAIGSLTVAFALGQCAGLVLAGNLSDHTNGVRAGLLLSAALLILGAVCALAQRGPCQAQPDEPEPEVDPRSGPTPH
jgi:Uncharacterised MFS-type transporter YbfB